LDHGLAWVRFPEGCAGLDQDQRWQLRVDERTSGAGGPMGNLEMHIVGVAMAAPTLVAHASVTLQKRLLCPPFTR
jgi:hypothetical protein